MPPRDEANQLLRSAESRTGHLRSSPLSTALHLRHLGRHVRHRQKPHLGSDRSLWTVRTRNRLQHRQATGTRTKMVYRSVNLLLLKGGAMVQRVRHFGLRSVGRGFKSCSRQRCVTTLGKLFTPMCLCHQAV